jgi:hypothetical protein
MKERTKTKRKYETTKLKDERNFELEKIEFSRCEDSASLISKDKDFEDEDLEDGDWEDSSTGLKVDMLGAQQAARSQGEDSRSMKVALWPEEDVTLNSSLSRELTFGVCIIVETKMQDSEWMTRLSRQSSLVDCLHVRLISTL